MNIWYWYISEKPSSAGTQDGSIAWQKLKASLYASKILLNLYPLKYIWRWIDCLTKIESFTSWIQDFQVEFLNCVSGRSIGLTSDRKGGLLSNLPLLQMNTTSLDLSCAQLMANWKRREVFPLLMHNKQRKYVTTSALFGLRQLFSRNNIQQRLVKLNGWWRRISITRKRDQRGAWMVRRVQVPWSEARGRTAPPSRIRESSADQVLDEMPQRSIRDCGFFLSSAWAELYVCYFLLNYIRLLHSKYLYFILWRIA